MAVSFEYIPDSVIMAACADQRQEGTAYKTERQFYLNFGTLVTLMGHPCKKEWAIKWKEMVLCQHWKIKLSLSWALEAFVSTQDEWHLWKQQMRKISYKMKRSTSELWTITWSSPGATGGASFWARFTSRMSAVQARGVRNFKGNNRICPAYPEMFACTDIET